jgi:hypothetical protein
MGHAPRAALSSCEAHKVAITAFEIKAGRAWLTPGGR